MAKDVFRYHSGKKRRSPSQKASLAKAHATCHNWKGIVSAQAIHLNKDKENYSEGANEKINDLTKKMVKYHDDLYNTRKKCKREQHKAGHVQAELREQLEAADQAQKTAQHVMLTVRGQNEELQCHLVAAQLKATEKIKHNATLRKKVHMLHMQSYWAKQSKEKAVKTARAKALTFKMKNRGMVIPRIRGLVRDLVSSIGLKQNQVIPAIKWIGQELDVDVEGSPTAWSIGWIVLEGGVAVQMQIADEAEKADGESKMRQTPWLISAT